MERPWLITGANGQVGWELLQQAQSTGFACVGLDRAALDIADAANVSAVFEAHRPCGVINAAAYTSVDKAEDEPDRAFLANQDGPRNLAIVCETASVPLIHISTDYVFDGSKAGAYVEDDQTAPLGVYGASKLAGEEAVRAACTRHLILRTAWVYGNHGHNFVKTMLRLGRERDELSVVADQTGCPTFAADLAAAILNLAAQLQNKASAGHYGTFHCTNSGATTWHGFADAIFQALKAQAGQRPLLKAITTKDYPTPAKRPKNSVLDCTKLESAVGLRLRPWADSLAEMLRREFENVRT